MYGISEQEERNFYHFVQVAANRAKLGKESAYNLLLELGKRAEELIAQHEKALKEYYENIVKLGGPGPDERSE